jgi:hypothetical protein
VRAIAMRVPDEWGLGDRIEAVTTQRMATAQAAYCQP